MKVFCGVQATGRGHLSRFAVVRDILEQHGHEVFGFATGRELPSYATGISKFVQGPSFFIRGNRIDLPASALYNARIVPGVFRAVRDTAAFLRSSRFDELIVDFEPVSARAARRAGREFTIFDNQTLSLMNLDYPPELRRTARFMRAFVGAYYGSLRGARRILTYSLLPLAPQLPGQSIIPPCVRREVRGLEATDGSHILFYSSIGELPPGVVEFARRNPDVEIRAYCTHAVRTPQMPDNITLPGRDNSGFLRDFASCRVYVTNAGFESVAESVWLRKPVVVVPIRGQAEQQMNAFLIARHGIGLSAPDFSAGTFDLALGHGKPPAPDVCNWVALGRETLEKALVGE